MGDEKEGFIDEFFREQEEQKKKGPTEKLADALSDEKLKEISAIVRNGMKNKEPWEEILLIVRTVDPVFADALCKIIDKKTTEKEKDHE